MLSKLGMSGKAPRKMTSKDEEELGDRRKKERDEEGRKSSIKFQNKKHFSKKWMPPRGCCVTDREKGRVKKIAQAYGFTVGGEND